MVAPLAPAVAVGPAAVAAPAKAAAQPGVPEDPVELYAEDFENVTGDPVLLTSYTGAAPQAMTYTANAGWLTGCNGWVLDKADSASFTPGTDDCGTWWSPLRDLVDGLGRLNGSADSTKNHGVAAFTISAPAANSVQFETQRPIPVSPGRFLTFSVSSAAMNCNVSGPQLKFFLMDGATAVPASNGAINPCTDTSATTYSIGGRSVKAVHAASDAPVLFSGSELGIRMVNANGSPSGNDAAFDDIEVLDVTPRVDKAFSPGVAPSGSTSTLTFTVTNTSDLLQKKGWSFTDDLPVGLTVADPAGVSTTCTNGSVAATPGGTSVQLVGDLDAGQASCTLSVDVTASKGEYQNCPVNLTALVGIDAPTECAAVTFDDPAYQIVKTSSPVAGTTVSAGSEVGYTVTVTNTGTVPVTAPVTDDLTEVLDDATYNGDAEAGTGTPAYTAPEITWSSTLAPGASATMTYSVTLNNALTGDGTVTNAVTGSSQSNCVTGAEAGCTTTVTVKQPQIGDFCSDVAYLYQLVNGESDLYELDLSAGTQTMADTDTMGPSIGYSRLDGAVVGIAANGTLSRWDPSTGETVYIKVSGWPTGQLSGLNSAANSVDGTLLYTRDYGTSRLFTIDIDPTSPTYGSVVATVATTDVGNVADWAVNPVDGYLYGVLNDGSLRRLNPATGAITNLGVKVPAAQGYGGVYFDDLGNFFAVNNPTGVIYQFDLTTSTAADPITAAEVKTPQRAGQTNPTTGNDAAGCLRPYDFGDAPDSYGTSKAADGARFVADNDLTLGAGVTAERDAWTPLDGTSDADDALTTVPGPADGVGTYQLTVPVNNATGRAATLAGWVDFDRDGTFDAGERALVPVPAGATSVDLAWTGLTGGVAGDSYVRLRLYEGTVADPQPSGFVATAGEVEDYQVKILSLSVTVAKTADKADAVPGATVTYTVLVTNTGEADYPGATFSDDLSGVLDDAVYNGDASATIGETEYAAPTLTWTGDVPAAGTAEITYSVTVKDPATGDKKLTNAVVGGTNCPAGSTDPACRPVVPVKSLDVVKTADRTDAVPGDTVNYTITVTNTGEAAYPGAVVTDDLSGVIDDATYNGDASATTGEAVYAAPTLTWTGSVPVDGVVTITYSVRVNDPVTGDGKLANVVVGPPGTNCPAGSTDPKCTPVVPVKSLEVVKTADRADALPGDTVNYTITVTNTGEAAYPDAVVTDDLSGVIDDATYNGDASATTGEAVYAAPTLTWTGSVPVDGVVTITYSVKVNDPVTGDGKLANVVVGPPGTNCPAGSTDPKCTPVVPVKSLVIVKKATPNKPGPGDTVSYTIEITNTGQADYSATTLTDDLTRVLDDATYNDDASATSGLVTYAEPILTWTGGIPVDGTVTITYTMRMAAVPAGDDRLVNTVVGPPGSNCPEGSTDPRCSKTLPAPPYDFGDAPDSYQTRLASDGPYHEIVPGLRIGGGVEADMDGMPGRAARGDADEEGVTVLPVIYQDQEKAVLTVPVTNTTGRAAVLAGWIDFDINGVFDEGELATADVPDRATKAVLTWSGTKNPVTGTTYLRLRLYGDPREAARALRQQTPQPYGYGGPGEVEDHVGEVVPVPDPKADLEMRKTALADVVRPGVPFDYELEVVNHGPAAAEDVVITDLLPGPIGFVSSEDGCTAKGQLVTCPPIATLASGATASVRITVMLRQGYTGDGSDLVNTGTATSGTSDPNPENNQDKVKVPVDTCDKKSGAGCGKDKDGSKGRSKDGNQGTEDRAMSVGPMAGTGSPGALLGLAALLAVTAGVALVRIGRGGRSIR
ncbi:GEVED domain-containing protein [Streptomyces sp. NPDC051940]|uniref:DUF7927 domain-containing protein n=1 Tax=Streptomyces sp. NPDC051940 TaxID=3155675 RepID=UPI00343552B2